MGAKTIAVRTEAYNFLSKLKLPNESFSDAILRIGKKNSSVMDLAGSWKDMSDKEFAEFEENIETLRKKMNKMVKR